MAKYDEMCAAYRNHDTELHYSPTHLYVEITNCCNLNCQHCGLRFMKRKKGYMEFRLVEWAAKQCQKYGIEWVYLWHLGESLLHPDIEAIISTFHIYNTKVRIHTNGTIFNKFVKDHTDSIHISLNDTPFETIRSNVDKWLDGKADIVLEMINGITPPLPPEYNDKFVHRKPFLNWRHLPHRYSNRNYVRCSQLWKTMVILWDGRCYPCSQQSDDDIVVGSIPDTDIFGLWNSSTMQKLRSEPSELCQNCAMAYIPEAHP